VPLIGGNQPGHSNIDGSEKQGGRPQETPMGRCGNLPAWLQSLPQDALVITEGRRMGDGLVQTNMRRTADGNHFLRVYYEEAGVALAQACTSPAVLRKTAPREGQSSGRPLDAISYPSMDQGFTAFQASSVGNTVEQTWRCGSPSNQSCTVSRHFLK
jgi:hypothetical protein